MPQAFKKYTNAEQDGRVKILPEEHKVIKIKHKQGQAIRSLAREYKVNKKLIQFILRPEYYKATLARRQAEKVHLKYYNREEHTKAIKKYRDKKRELGMAYNPNHL